MKIELKTGQWEYKEIEDVPPFMMQRIANQIAIQFFNKNS